MRNERVHRDNVLGESSRCEDRTSRSECCHHGSGRATGVDNLVTDDNGIDGTPIPLEHADKFCEVTGDVADSVKTSHKLQALSSSS